MTQNCKFGSCFNKQMEGVHKFVFTFFFCFRGKPIDYFLHEKPVYGLSLQPGSQSIFATACDDGKLRVFDMRCSVSEESILASKRSPFHSIMFHPIEGRIVVSASAKDLSLIHI